MDYGDVARALRGRNCDSLDEVCHGHFDVELHEIGKGVELDVSKCRLAMVLPTLCDRVQTYTKEFGIDIAAMIMTSMSNETMIIR